MLFQHCYVCERLVGINAADQRGIVTIPPNETLDVVSYSEGDRFLTVRWKERDLLVFAQDLAERVVSCD
jgi:hypothetical protein